MSEEDRRAFAVPTARGECEGVDLALLDPNDEDERRILIEAEHPELLRALRGGQREVHVEGRAMNPVLHIAMHEIVANHLWANDPPEVWETAQRLVAAGYPRHEVLHMLASVVSAEMFEIMGHQAPHDIERVRDGLAALPQSWEERRAGIPAERHTNRAERRAAARKRSH